MLPAAMAAAPDTTGESAPSHVCDVDVEP